MAVSKNRELHWEVVRLMKARPSLTMETHASNACDDDLSRLRDDEIKRRETGYLTEVTNNRILRYETKT